MTRDAHDCIVLLGPPGAGKSTQGGMLARRFGLRRIASGELLHEHVAAGTPRGVRARRYMQAGELAPDELLVDIVTEAVAADPSTGVVLDGFPRTAAQARLADEMLAAVGRSVRLVVEFAVDAATVRGRIADRYRDRGRFDDHPDVVERRLAAARPPAALVDYYRARGVYSSIDANQPEATVSAELLTLLAGAAAPIHPRAERDRGVDRSRQGARGG
jgi:adenylate kinase